MSATDTARHFATQTAKRDNAPSLDKLNGNLLHSREAARILGVSEAWLARERWKGTGPVYVRVGGPSGRSVRYRFADLNGWIAANTVSPSKGRG